MVVLESNPIPQPTLIFRVQIKEPFPLNPNFVDSHGIYFQNRGKIFAEIMPLEFLLALPSNSINEQSTTCPVPGRDSRYGITALNSSGMFRKRNPSSVASQGAQLPSMRVSRVSSPWERYSFMSALDLGIGGGVDSGACLEKFRSCDVSAQGKAA